MGPSSVHPVARVFFALWPTAAEREALAAWQAPLYLRCGGRKMRSETLHSTLVFVGEIDQAKLDPLRRAAEEVSTEGFELCIDAARYWGHSHIVYAAPDHVPPQLKHLVRELEQSLARHGFNLGPREYKPHITLLRKAQRTGTEWEAMRPVCWQVQAFALVQSVPQGGWMGYRVLARFPLGPSGGEANRQKCSMG